MLAGGFFFSTVFAEEENHEQRKQEEDLMGERTYSSSYKFDPYPRSVSGEVSKAVPVVEDYWDQLLDYSAMGFRILWTDWAPSLFQVIVASGTGTIRWILDWPLAPGVIPEIMEEPLLPDETLDQFGRSPRTLVTRTVGAISMTSWGGDYGYIIAKRPGLDQLTVDAMNCGYELVIWSRKYKHKEEQHLADLDPLNLWRTRLFTDAGGTVDLTKLGRDLRRIIFVTATPEIIYPNENVVYLKPIVKFTADSEPDRELLRLNQFLKDISRYDVEDVRPYIKQFNENPNVDLFEQEHKMEAEARQQMNTDPSRDQSSGNVMGWAKTMLMRK